MENLDKVYAQRIAEEYAPKSTSKVVKLKKLDQKVKKPAYVLAYLLGVFGALVLGTGMSFSMGVIGNDDTLSMVIGVVTGVVGIVLCAINYPIYKKLLASRKAKYAFEITELAKEISENN